VKYCDEQVSLFLCLSVCPRGYLQNHTRSLYQIFCACCMSVALSSGMLMIGRITYQREGGDGSALRGLSGIYDYLVLCVVCGNSNSKVF